MFFATSITIPEGTSKANATEATLELTAGRIVRWFVGFPPGCAGLAYVTIHRFEHQILPKGEGTAIAWDGYVFEAPEQYDIDSSPFEVLVRGWSDDDTYPHTVLVAAVMEPIPEETTVSLLQALKQAFIG